MTLLIALYNNSLLPLDVIRQHIVQTSSLTVALKALSKSISSSFQILITLKNTNSHFVSVRQVFLECQTK